MTDQDLLNALQFAVLEPADGGNSWTSELWSRDEVLGSLNQRQSKFLKNTLARVSKADGTTVPSLNVPANTNVVTLPSDLIRLVTVTWIGSDGTIRELLRSDSFELDHLTPTWDSPTASELYPRVYAEYELPTLQLWIAPQPNVAGMLEILYVDRGTAFLGTGVGLALPDELGHALKYGTLADLLSKDGRGKDVARAEYADQRFDLAVELVNIILKGWA